MFPRGVSASLGKVVGATPVGACSRVLPGASSSLPNFRVVSVASTSSSSVIAGSGTQEEPPAQAIQYAAGTVELGAVRDACMTLVFSRLPIAWTACFFTCC
ncbi:hypothetical protein MTO96_046190 [Rhipicephalus appendiculatus]